MSDKLGKLNHTDFDKMIRDHCGSDRREVHTGPEFGVDVSVVELPNEMALVSSSDPLSLVPSLGLEESAWLSVHLLANDMATSGIAPQYGQFVLNLPSGFPENDFKNYWNYIDKFCKNIDVAITGGHTGFIEGQNSTIAGGGTFSSIGPLSAVLTTKMANPGDKILVTKECALVSTSILAKSFPETIINRTGKEVQQKAEELFHQTSALNDALIAVNASRGVTAMHDVTEGGVLGAIYEMATASGCGVLVDSNALPIGEVQKEIGSLFSIDPRYCVGAGSMVISCSEEAVDTVIKELEKNKIRCTLVGELKEKELGMRILEDNKESELIYIEDDPYWAAFFKALKEGWT